MTHLQLQDQWLVDEKRVFFIKLDLISPKGEENTEEQRTSGLSIAE